MSTEKHNTGDLPMTSQPVDKPNKNKPVVIYIMILFIAAFLLMALSSLMHQRSNTEALGQLQTSFHATMEEIQETQLQINALEKELAETKAALEAAQADAEDANARLDAAEIDLEAQRQLYFIQQKYAAGDYEACAVLIEEMESSGLAALLPSAQMSTSAGSVTAPSVRFYQFKYAVEQKLAEQTASEESSH